MIMASEKVMTPLNTVASGTSPATLRKTTNATPTADAAALASDGPEAARIAKAAVVKNSRIRTRRYSYSKETG
jgi:hypothetical protein